jgi:RNA polymerase sigma-70 factor (ECF subfamily)
MIVAMPTKSDAAEDDVRLIQEFKSGKEAAFTQLVQKYQQPVFNLLYHYSGRRQDVEDLAQEVFIKVYTNLMKFETRAAFRTWLYRIALNVSIDHARKQKRRRMLSLEGLTDWARERLAFRAATAPSPHSATERHELETQIQLGLEALPEDFRQVLVLRDIEGMEYDDIAAILGWQLGTVKSRLFRARQRLRKFLEPYVEDDK